MAFSDEEIRAMVHTGEYSSAETETTVAETLIRRRDLIGKTFFPKVLPLDDFRVENDRLVFQDLAARYKIRPETGYQITWSHFDNQRNERGPGPDGSGEHLPRAALSSAEGAYWAATIRDSQLEKSVTVFLRKERTGWKLVGIERDGENAWRPR